MKKLFLAIFIVTASINVFSQNEKVEAMFLYSFAKYIIWPDGIKNDDYVIGVVGNEELSKELTKFCNNRSVGSKKIVIRSFENISGNETINMLVVGESCAAKISSYASKLGRQTVIVSEKERMFNKGSEICFKKEDDKLKFEMSRNNIMDKGLYIDKRLLDYAILVD
jgi:phosphoribosylamine-glycine ligase